MNRLGQVVPVVLQNITCPTRTGVAPAKTVAVSVTATLAANGDVEGTTPSDVVVAVCACTIETSSISGSKRRAFRK